MMSGFPGRLMTLLNDENVQKCMHWLPSGLAFEISNPELFVDTVLRIHFNSVQFESFVVRLGKWGFRRLGDKVNKRYLTYTFGSPLFCRDKPHLCNSMTLVKKIKPSRDKKLLIHMFDATKEPTAVPSIDLKKAPVFNHTDMPSWRYHSCLSSAHLCEQYTSFSLQQNLLHSSARRSPHGFITNNVNRHQERLLKLKQEKDQNAAAAALTLMNLANSEWSEIKPAYACTNKGPPSTRSNTF
eukprot:CCRYP_005707-RA/>CCRYP_005707-RA protein AED:0.00 eAED:0.00 QI:238/1/1/1/0/0/2/174/240